MELKRITEQQWSQCAINPTQYGFQFQRGTRWNPGLSAEQVESYERALNAEFPHDFKLFLQAMNGTDLPVINVYGSSGHSPRESEGVYSYPKDIEIVEERIEHIRESRREITECLSEQGYELPPSAGLVPIYGHRFVVCADLDSSTVLSIVVHATDAIVYGESLADYLRREFLTP